MSDMKKWMNILNEARDTLTESRVYDAGVADGQRGQKNPRAASIYGPQSAEYDRGFEHGMSVEKQAKSARAADYEASLAPYQDMSTSELQQMVADIRSRTASGASSDYKKDRKVWQAITQVLQSRGEKVVEEGNTSSPSKQEQRLKSKSNKELADLIEFWNQALEKYPESNGAREQLALIKKIRAERIGKKGVAKGLSEMDNRSPSGDRREQRAYSPEAIAQRKKELQADLKKVSPEMREKLGLPEPKEGVAEGSEDSNIQSAIVDTVERLFRKNEISDYGALEAIHQGVKHHFSKPGATDESAIEGILNILDKRMRKSGDYVDLGRFKEALRQGITHQLKKQGVTEAKGLNKLVKVVKGPHAGKTGWIREVKHGAHKTAPKSFYVDLEDGSHADNLPGTALRLVKEKQGVAEGRLRESSVPGKRSSVLSKTLAQIKKMISDGEWEAEDDIKNVKPGSHVTLRRTKTKEKKAYLIKESVAEDNDTVYKDWRKNVGTDYDTTLKLVDKDYNPNAPRNREDELAKMNKNLKGVAEGSEQDFKVGNKVRFKNRTQPAQYMTITDIDRNMFDTKIKLDLVSGWWNPGSLVHYEKQGVAEGSSSKLSSPFEGGRKTTSITPKHKPLVWENMLGTVMAKDPASKAEPKYFDYKWDDARAYAKVDQCDDLRICKSPGLYQGWPEKGKMALWGILRKGVAEGSLNEAQKFDFTSNKQSIMTFIDNVLKNKSNNKQFNPFYALIVGDPKIGGASKLGLTPEFAAVWKKYFQNPAFIGGAPEPWSQYDLGDKFPKATGDDRTLNFYITVDKEKNNVAKFINNINKLPSYLKPISDQYKTPIKFKTHSLLDSFIGHNDSLKVYYYDPKAKDSVVNATKQWLSDSSIATGSRSHEHGVDVKSGGGSFGQILSNHVYDSFTELIKNNGNKFTSEQYFTWLEQHLPALIKQVQQKAISHELKKRGVAEGLDPALDQTAAKLYTEFSKENPDSTSYLRTLQAIRDFLVSKGIVGEQLKKLLPKMQLKISPEYSESMEADTKEKVTEEWSVLYDAEYAKNLRARVRMEEGSSEETVREWFTRTFQPMMIQELRRSDTLEENPLAALGAVAGRVGASAAKLAASGAKSGVNAVATQALDAIAKATAKDQQAAGGVPGAQQATKAATSVPKPRPGQLAIKSLPGKRGVAVSSTGDVIPFNNIVTANENQDREVRSDSSEIKDTMVSAHKVLAGDYDYQRQLRVLHNLAKTNNIEYYDLLKAWVQDREGFAKAVKSLDNQEPGTQA